jgi:CDP-glycerol glycerophosphotransferase (TagB/SpsB family)
VEPDLIFYPQPYPGTLEDVHSYEYYIKKLILYVPYAFVSRNAQYYDFNSEFSNLAWRLYYPTEESRMIATQNTIIRGKNVVVTGYSSADDYALPMTKDPWNKTDRSMKRIIWAPHFTISERLGFSQISNFLNVADYMQQLANEYQDKIQFAFKPHPRLYTELCNHPDWGLERANEYYDFWRNGINTQLETSGFIDLFKGSDALIHDSGSFTIDYLYFGKPVLYDSPNIEEAKRTGTPICQMAYDMHYKSKTPTDIKRFIDDVVLAGYDTMKEKRIEFCKKYLMPPNGMSVSQRVYDDMIQSLGVQ